MLQIGGAANAAALAQMYMQQQQYGGGQGCCCPPPPPPPCCPPHGNNQYHGNLPDATVGKDRNCWFLDETRGFGLDLNNNGRYDAGKDGVLAFDLNKDGKITNDEIEQSRDRLKAFGGDYDFNADGKVSFCEKLKGRALGKQMQGMDHDGDGRLSGAELAQGGGRVLIDRDQNGKFSPWESYSPHSFPTPGFGRGSLNYVDPRFGHNSVNQNWSWARPTHH